MIEIDMSYALLVVDIAKIVCRMICFLVAQRRLPTSPDLFISITPGNSIFNGCIHNARYPGGVWLVG
jgi:hypothetical protein